MKASQNDRILALLSDGKPHSTVEIQQVVYGADHVGSAAIPSRISDLNKREGIVIEGKPGKVNKSVWWYKLVSEPTVSAPKKKQEFKVILRDGRPVAVPVND